MIEHQRYLHAIAYRMLGSAADADDMVQETWLRWQRETREDVQNPRAWLAGVVTRLCIDRLRELKRRREEYIGPWLPEPLIEAPPDGAELAESLSLAFMTLLERLTAMERAVLLLRQVFSYEYAEIAAIVGKSEAACRQQFSRAQKHLSGERSRFETTAEAQQRMMESFIEATSSGDLSRIEAILRDDVEFISDGGGKVPATMRTLTGRSVVSRLLHGLAAQAPAGISMEFTTINGQLGALMRVDGRLDTVWVIDSVNGQAQAIRAIRNPDKLARLG